MTKPDRHIAALVNAAKKAQDKTKLKMKIKKIKQQQSHLNWLAQ